MEDFYCLLLLLLLLLLTLSILVVNWNNLLYTVANNPARDLLNRGKRTKKKENLAARTEKMKQNTGCAQQREQKKHLTRRATHDESTCLGATQVSACILPVQDCSARQLG